MTEEEKRALALSIMKQEQQRLATSTFRDHQAAESSQAARRIAANQAVFSRLAQRGITWQQLKEAYDEAFNEGHEAMIDHHLSYLYAGAAIAYHEAFDTFSDDTADFVRRIAAIPDEIADRTELVRKALDTIGLDTTEYDDNGQPPQYRAMITAKTRATRKDRKAVARMKESGITQDDLEYEKRLGYSNGWNSGFYFSACYAAVALALAEFDHRGEARAFIDRLEELRYEEITAQDIMDRAVNETGVDVSGVARKS